MSGHHDKTNTHSMYKCFSYEIIINEPLLRGYLLKMDTFFDLRHKFFHVIDVYKGDKP